MVIHVIYNEEVLMTYWVKLYSFQGKMPYMYIFELNINCYHKYLSDIIYVIIYFHAF